MAEVTLKKLKERRRTLVGSIGDLQNRAQQYRQATAETDQQIQANSGAVAMLNTLLTEDFGVDLEELDKEEAELAQSAQQTSQPSLAVVDNDSDGETDEEKVEETEVEEITL